MSIFRSVELPTELTGRLSLSAMPGRFEPWAAFVAEARRENVGLIVCLASRDEMARYAPEYHAAVTGRGLPVPMRWLHVPMSDFGLSAHPVGYQAGIEQAVAQLHTGAHVLLHCAAGIGRTGTTAACVLKRLGLSTSEALHRVDAAGSNPQHAVQSGLIERF